MINKLDLSLFVYDLLWMASPLTQLGEQFEYTVMLLNEINM